MITLHLITQDGQPYGSVRRCCEACGVMRSNAFGVYTTDRGLFERARENFLTITSMHAGLDDIVVTACNRPPLAFKKWNDRSWHIEGNWGHDPGDEDPS
jgi:hypothetical protein